MKKLKLLLLLPVFAFTLTSCAEEGGFSGGGWSNSEQYDTEEKIGSQEPNKDDTGLYSGGSGQEYEGEEPNKENGPIETVTPNNGEVPDIEKVNLGTQIIIFKFNIVALEGEYVFVSSLYSPFDEAYQFSYYTINDKKIENASSDVEIVESTSAYKFKIGNQSGLYSIKFYNKKDIQYGKADIQVNFPSEEVNPRAFFNVAFNLFRIHIVSFFNKLKESFQKIGESIQSIFNPTAIRK